MQRKTFYLIPVLFGNLWIYKIFSANTLAGLACISVTVFTWLFILKNSRLFLFFAVISTIILIVFQYKTTVTTPLTYLDNDGQRIQQMRIKEHPPVKLDIPQLKKTIYIPTANWFELRKEAVAFQKLQKNFSETLSLNLYFFSNHPRERVGIKEFEKFPYFWLPFFLTGLYLFYKNTRKNELIFISVFLIALPVITISIAGHNNPMGPFSLFPLITFVTAIGIRSFIEHLQKDKKGVLLAAAVLLIFGISFLQSLAYDIY